MAKVGERSARAAGRRGAHRGLALAWLTGLALVAPSVAHANANATVTASEAEVKAAFLLNFTRFVDWPPASFAAASDPFVICVLNDDAFAGTVSQVIGDRTVADRPVAVRPRASLGETSGCHILYLPDGEGALAPEVIARLSAESVFTVSDSDGFAERGGVANFKRAGTKLGLEINRAAAERAKLKVSARLLRIAEVVG